MAFPKALFLLGVLLVVCLLVASEVHARELTEQAEATTTKKVDGLKEAKYPGGGGYYGGGGYPGRGGGYPGRGGGYYGGGGYPGRGGGYYGGGGYPGRGGGYYGGGGRGCRFGCCGGRGYGGGCTCCNYPGQKPDAAFHGKPGN